MSEPRTDRCPICGADNACAMAAADGAAAACATCWCAAVEIPPAAMENIPARARGRACLCQRCATKLAAAPAEGVRLTRDPGGRPAVELASGEDRALIACDGGQLLSWRTRGHDPLWTASAATYEPAAPVRGGVPIVFPWFGAHPTDPELPAHGFARSREWVVVETAASAVTLALRDDEETRSKLTLATPSIFGMAITLCAARAPQATTLVMVAVVVHCGGGLRMRRSSKSMSSSSSSARSGAARGIGARTRVAHCGAWRSREGG